MIRFVDLNAIIQKQYKCTMVKTDGRLNNDIDEEERHIIRKPRLLFSIVTHECVAEI